MLVIREALSIVIALLTVARCCTAKKILFFSYPLYSHLTGPANVGEFLQSQGHSVLFAVPPQLKEKLEDYGIDFLLYHCLGDYLEQRSFQDFILKEAFSTTSILQRIQRLFIGNEASQLGTNVVIKMLKDVQLFKDIENFKPDLIVLDSTPRAIMLTLIPYMLDVPFIMMGTAELPQYTRTPIIPAMDPFLNLPYTDQMTFLQRLSNTITHLLAYRLQPFVEPSVISEYMANKPYISPVDLQAKAQLWIIIGQHSVFSYNPPAMPNVKRVGHLKTIKHKPLPPEFQSFVENADDGIVVVTFGSRLASMPIQALDKFLLAAVQTKFKFIIQGSRPKDTKQSAGKFMFHKWVPQFDLLRHPKTKLFITHCGSNGLQEALIAGVPIIGFPVFNDQPNNAGKIVRKGYGLKLDLKSFTVQELVSAIEEVTTNSSYETKVEKASAILKSERVPPIEEAAFWINHVLTFGGEHLRSYAQDIPLWKYLGLDIIVFCLLLCHVLVYLFMRIIKSCFVCCCGRNHQKLKYQ